MPEQRGRPGARAPEDVGWLCPTEQHRARMLDMGPRVVRARTIAAAAVGVGMLATIEHLGWWAFALFAAMLANLATVDWRIDRARRPERVVAGSVLLIIVLTGISAALTGGARSPVLALIVIPVVLSAARFRAQVVWFAAGSAVLVAILVATITGVQQAIDHPLTLIVVLVLLVAVTAAATALADAEQQFRSESVLDPLTGLLNRSGLEARFIEVREQARLLGRPVCLIMCDLDNFKRVNDRHGHERGDAVLREVSYEMRNLLRSFELFYRLGGEEFLILLPGIDLAGGVAIAQNLRAAVDAHRPGGLPVTASFGVSAAVGEEIEFLPLFKAADAALYRAKSGGRNLVVAAGMTPVVGSAFRDESAGDGLAA
jgi:diguanylate cyclase (GGDEF)-like protein